MSSSKTLDARQETKDLNLTLDQLKNYLGTGLEVEWADEKGTLIGINEKSTRPLIINPHSAWLSPEQYSDMHFVYPICYRLSALDRNLNPEQEGIFKSAATKIGIPDWEVEEIKEYGVRQWYHFQELIKLHFWPFGDEYFEEGLVIDKLNTQDSILNTTKGKEVPNV